jgi:hypothetical protein
VKKLLFLGVLVAAGAAVATQWPSVHRYIKMSNM